MGPQGVMVHSVKAHAGPISVLKCTAQLVVTGGYDHMVKV